MLSNANAEIAFSRQLHKKLDQYFRDHGLSKKADDGMFAKLTVAVIWWVGSLLLLFMFNTTPAVFAALYILHCLSQLFIFINIAHDANHNAISGKSWLNKLLAYSFDICGVNSYMWRCLHHRQHHYCMNIYGEDESLIARGLFRFTPETKRKPIHKFQHLYFLIPYSMFTANWILIKDFQCFFFPHTNFLKQARHPPIEYIKLFLGKALYLGYMIVLPVVLFGLSPAFVIGLFFTGHFIIGLLGAPLIQVTHPLESADFPKSKKDYSCFALHVLATTADYAVDSRLARCFYGGLNLHIAHHIAPHVCHMHYPELTKIIQTTCAEHGVTYRENKSLFSALQEHYRLLKRLSNA